jgi:hypothetical protein
MRFLPAVVIVLLAGCEPSRDVVLADAEKAQAELLRKVEPKQSLPAFGGTILGKDEGEWGGEVAFQEPDGTIYTVVADNSHGIFEMPYGVIALTGLAHLGSNRGTAHLLSRASGARVSAQPLMRLPGSPCDVVRVGDRINMRIPSGHKELPSGVLTSSYSCYALVSAKQLVQYKCPVPEAEICFG